MSYRVRRSLACRADLEAIFDHLVQSHRVLGAATGDAFDHAATRLAEIEDAIDGLGRAPQQGTLWPEVMEGLRWVAKGRAILYFTADETAQELRVLAVFFGGQDHKTHMLARLLQRG